MSNTTRDEFCLNIALFSSFLPFQKKLLTDIIVALVGHDVFRLLANVMRLRKERNMVCMCIFGPHIEDEGEIISVFSHHVNIKLKITWPQLIKRWIALSTG